MVDSYKENISRGLINNNFNNIPTFTESLYDIIQFQFMIQAKTIFILTSCLQVVWSWSQQTYFTPPGDDQIFCLDISADGAKLVVGGQAQKVVIYQTTTFTQIGLYNAPNIPKAIKFSPDGNFIVIGYQADSATILSGTTYALIQNLATGHSKVHDIDFTADSSSMITCGDNKKFRIWDTSTWTSTFTSTDLGQVLWKCTYSSDGKYAIGLDPGDVRIYSSGNSQLSSFTPSSSGKPYDIDFKQGTTDFIMGSDNSNGYLSSSSSPFLNTDGIIWVAKYAKSTNYFMFAGEDRKVHIFNSTNQQEFTFEPGNDEIYCGDFSDTECLLALCSDDQVYIYSSNLDSCEPTPPTPPTPPSPPTPPTPPPTPSTDPSSEENSTNCTIGFYENTNGDCQLCIESIPGCGVCSSITQCLYCLPGTYLDSGNTCSNCASQIEGCLICDSSSNCLQCQNDYYLELGNCESCTQVDNCLHCSSSSACLTCKLGYYESGGICQNCPLGCKDCSDGSTCLNCQATHTLQGSSCSLCKGLMEGCFICSDTSTCTSCLSGYYINNNQCKPCKQSLEGCLLCSDIDTCLQCQQGFHLQNDNTCQKCSLVLDGCIQCDNQTYCSQCQVGYHKDITNSCSLCSELIQGCLFCTSSHSCSVCKAGYSLNTNTNECDLIPVEQAEQIVCNIAYCLDCIQDNLTNQTQCSVCLPTHYEVDGLQCRACSLAIKGCQECVDSMTCSICDINYYLSADSICQLCSYALQGCALCNSSYCLECKQGFYENDGECSSCQSIQGCVRCSTQNSCNQCKGGYFLNETFGCQPCTDLLGCSFCQNKQKCTSCIVGYFRLQGKCQTCSYISNCFHCINSVCLLCKNGYLLVEGTCQLLALNLIQKNQVINISLSLKTHYISENQLKHTLFVRGAKFVQLETNYWSSLTSMKIKDPNGQEVTLNITSVEWGSNGYTLIYYTDNPYKITIQDIAKMNLTRRLLQSSIINNYQIQLDMQKTVLSEILPQYRNDAQGLVMQYSLDKPEFVRTIFQGFNAYSYHLFGIVIVCILFIQYFVKVLFTNAATMDFGQIIPHIMSLKTGILILYPTYLEYFDFCYGFYVADFPWANNQVGEVLGNQSDTQPFSYASLYVNMNFASTYLIAFSVICGLVLILFILSKRFEHEQRIKNGFEFLYCFFIFGLTLAGCASLQGAMMNPLSQMDVNACFYIFGILVYSTVVLECIYKIKKDIKYIWKLRILIKATLLSLAHLNPIFISAITIIIDIWLAFVDYKMVKKSPKYVHIVLYPRLWLVDNIIINIALGLLIFLPSILLEIILICLLVSYLIISSIFVQIQEILRNRKTRQQKQMKTENQANNSEQFQQNQHELKKNDTIQTNNYVYTQQSLVNNLKDDEQEIKDEKFLIFHDETSLRGKYKKRKKNKTSIIKNDLVVHEDPMYTFEVQMIDQA